MPEPICNTGRLCWYKGMARAQIPFLRVVIAATRAFRDIVPDRTGLRHRTPVTPATAFAILILMLSAWTFHVHAQASAASAAVDPAVLQEISLGGPITYLDPEERARADIINEQVVARPWELCKRRVAGKRD